MPTTNCKVCGKFVSVSGTKCCKCMCSCHRECAVKTASNSGKPVRWICRSCSKNPTHTRSPVLDNIIHTTDNSTSNSSSPLTEAREEIVLSSDIKLIHTELGTISREMTLFRQELARLTETVGKFNERIDDIEKRVTTLENSTEERINSLENKIAKLNLDCDSMVQYTLLDTEFNERDQKCLRNDIELLGITESIDENLYNIAVLVGEKLGVELEERDIVFATRKGPRNSSHGPRLRPRPIIIRTARTPVRDELLRAARGRHRGANTSGFNIDSVPKRFFVNERLTHINQHLFYLARKEGKRKGWRHVWTQGGAIYARQTSSSTKYKITSDKDLEQCFGNAVVV